MIGKTLAHCGITGLLGMGEIQVGVFQEGWGEARAAQRTCRLTGTWLM